MTPLNRLVMDAILGWVKTRASKERYDDDNDFERDVDTTGDGRDGMV